MMKMVNAGPTKSYTSFDFKGLVAWEKNGAAWKKQYLDSGVANQF